MTTPRASIHRAARTSLAAVLLASMASTTVMAQTLTSSSSSHAAAVANALSVSTFGTAKTVLLAREDVYADALTGSSLAGHVDGPILFTGKDTLAAHAKDAIDTLKPQLVIILGGTEAISPAIEESLTKSGIKVERVRGANRFETAVAVAKRLYPTTPPKEVFFVEGDNADPQRGWPDAITIAAGAAKNHAPILLVNKDAVPSETASLWTTWQPDVAKSWIVGGTAAVSKPVATTLQGKAKSLPRLSGDNRYGTSAKTYQYMVSEADMNPNIRYVVPGNSFVEGLAAGAIGAHTNHPVVMVDVANEAPSAASLAMIAGSADLLESVEVVNEDAFSNEMQEAIMGAQTTSKPTYASCITLLHHNDGESQILGTGRDDNYGSLARLVTLVHQEQAKAKAANCPAVTVSSGDNFLAGPELAASKPSDESGTVLDSVGMSHVGYDAIDIGNHDLDFGPDFLARFIGSFTDDTPFLSANLDVSKVPSLQALQQAGRIAPSITKTLSDGKVGIIGLTTPTLRTISSPGKIEVKQEVVKIVQGQIDTMKTNGVERIILISHMQGLSADFELVKQLSGLDAVVAGGGDEILGGNGEALVPGDMVSIADTYPVLLKDKDGDVVPTVTTAGDYKYLGRLTLYFDEHGELIEDTPYDANTSRMVRVNDEKLPQGVARDATVVKDVEQPIKGYVAGLEKNKVATSEVVLNGVRPDIRIEETNLGDIVADAHRYTALTNAAKFGLATDVPVVGFQNGGGIRNNTKIPAGDITELTTFDILPFANFTGAVPDMTIEHFKQILERGYSGIEHVAGGFIHLSKNVKVSVDITKPAQEIAKGDAKAVTITKPGERVRSLEIDGVEVIKDGKIVKPGYTLTVATIDFSIRNGDAYPFNLPDGGFTALGASYQQSLYNYLKAPVAKGGLGGAITAADYPEGGQGRITITK